MTDLSFANLVLSTHSRCGAAKAYQPPSNRVPWTEAHIEILVRMYVAGESYVDIQAALGRTMPSIESKVRDLGLSDTAGRRYIPWPDDKTEQLRALITAGADLDEMITQLGRSRGSIKGKIARIRSDNGQEKASLREACTVGSGNLGQYPTTTIKGERKGSVGGSAERGCNKDVPGGL